MPYFLSTAPNKQTLIVLISAPMHTNIQEAQHSDQRLEDWLVQSHSSMLACVSLLATGAVASPCRPTLAKLQEATLLLSNNVQARNNKALTHVLKLATDIIAATPATLHIHLQACCR
jgi:hypothetical protein